MASVRTSLTATYAAALLGSMLALGGTLYAARRASAFRDLGQQVFTEADVALRVVRQLRDVPEPAVRDTSAGATPQDSIARRVVSPRIRQVLEGVPDYLLVLSDSGRTVFASQEVRRLSADDFALLYQASLTLSNEAEGRQVNLDQEQVLIRARFDTTPEIDVSRVVAGAPTERAAAAPIEMMSTMLLVAPVIFIVSLIAAYVIAGRALSPVDRIMDDVAAISDGRSLHRRLPVEEHNDELARLAVTLNAMIGRLETSFGALRRFTADASHELKTPLTVLRADVERAMGHTTTPHERMVALEEALQETARMSDLVDSLLTLARFDEGRFDLHREPIELEPLVHDVFETATILGESAGLEVSLAVAEPVTVSGDGERLRQLFLNLVTNAIKYTPRGGKVELSLSRRLDAITFSVRDTGLGIAAVDLPFVFERFWRADRARSRRGAGDTARGGFGLGLAISQWIAQAHGGSLAVQSRLGRGSTFTVTLPFHASPHPTV